MLISFRAIVKGFEEAIIVTDEDIEKATNRVLQGFREDIAFEKLRTEDIFITRDDYFVKIAENTAPSLLTISLAKKILEKIFSMEQ